MVHVERDVPRLGYTLGLAVAIAGAAVAGTGCQSSSSDVGSKGGDAGMAAPQSAVGGDGGAGGEAAAPKAPLPDVEGSTVLEDSNPDESIVEVSLKAAPGTWEIVDGTDTEVLSYNDALPGPLLHARVGDRVIVHFTNEMDEATMVHWHGLRISDKMDGSPMIQDPVEPGASFTYDFVVPDAGTFWYHTHYAQIEQLERGLYGAIVVHEAEFPRFSKERLFVLDDIRLDEDGQVAPFTTAGMDLMHGRTGNILLANGKEVPLKTTIAAGSVERWRLVLASNALDFALRVKGATVRVIATDGGLLPEAFVLGEGGEERVAMAPGQRYDLEVRPEPGATKVVLEAVMPQLDENNQVVDASFDLVRAQIEGSVSAEEPVYPAITLPSTAVDADLETWKIGGVAVEGGVEFSIDGKSGFIGGDHEHAILATFQQNIPVRLKIRSQVSPGHPFHIHGQFFQILERNGDPVFEPGLRDTVHVRGADSVTILSYFENPGQWMVHCHISEHAENGMMGDIVVEPTDGADEHSGMSMAH